MRELLDKLYLLENSKRYVPVKGSIIQQDIRKLIGNRKDIYIDSSANDRTVNVVQVDPGSGRVYQRYMVGVRSTPPLFRKIKKFLQTSPQQNFKTVPQIQQQFKPPAGDIPDGGSSDVDGTNQAGTNQDGAVDGTTNGSTAGPNDQYGLDYTQSSTSNGSTAGPALSTDRVDGPIGQVDPEYGVTPDRPPVSVPTVTSPDSIEMSPTTADPVDGIDSLDNQPGSQQFNNPTDGTDTVPDIEIGDPTTDDPGNMQQLQRPEVKPEDESEVEPETEPEFDEEKFLGMFGQRKLLQSDFEIDYALNDEDEVVYRLIFKTGEINTNSRLPVTIAVGTFASKKEAEKARGEIIKKSGKQSASVEPKDDNADVDGADNQQLGTQVINTNIDKYDAPTTAINIIFDKESSGNIDTAPGDGGASFGGMQVMTDPRLKGAIDEWIRHGMSDDTIDDIKKDKKLQMEIGVWYYTLLYTLLGGKGTPRKRKLAYKAQNLHKDFKKYRTKDHTINFTDKSTLIIPKGIDPRFVYAAMMYNGGPDEVNTKTGVAKLATKQYAKDFLKRLKDQKGISDSNQYIDRICILSGIDKYMKMPKEIVVGNSMRTLVKHIDTISNQPISEGWKDDLKDVVNRVGRKGTTIEDLLKAENEVKDISSLFVTDASMIGNFYGMLAVYHNFPLFFHADGSGRASLAKRNPKFKDNFQVVANGALEKRAKEAAQKQAELGILPDKIQKKFKITPATQQDKDDNVEKDPSQAVIKKQQDKESKPNSKQASSKGKNNRFTFNDKTPVEINPGDSEVVKLLKKRFPQAYNGMGEINANNFLISGLKDRGFTTTKQMIDFLSKKPVKKQQSTSAAKSPAPKTLTPQQKRAAAAAQSPASKPKTSKPSGLTPQQKRAAAAAQSPNIGSQNTFNAIPRREKPPKNPETAKLRRLSPKRTYQRNSVNLTTKESNMLTEASMNVSMNGASAGEVAELMALLKNAGMPEPKSMAVMAPSGMSPGPIKTSGCGCGSMGEDTVEEEYANEPDETTMDTAYMTKDLAGGLNRPKDKGALRAKDPAIDHSEMRESLRKALEAKYIQEIDIPKDDSATSKMPTQKVPSMKGLPCPSRGYSEQQIKALRTKLEMAMQDKKRPWQAAAFTLEKILKMTNHCYDHAEIVVDKLMDKIRAANGGEFPKKKGFFGGIFDSTKDNTSTELESISKLAGIK